MAKFKYTAIDANGKQKTGTVEADTQDEASSKLSASGLMPTKITTAGGGATGRPGAVCSSASDGSPGPAEGGGPHGVRHRGPDGVA